MESYKFETFQSHPVIQKITSNLRPLARRIPCNVELFGSLIISRSLRITTEQFPQRRGCDSIGSLEEAIGRDRLSFERNSFDSSISVETQKTGQKRHGSEGGDAHLGRVWLGHLGVFGKLQLLKLLYF